MAVGRQKVGTSPRVEPREERQSPFEPLTITPRYPAPRAHVNADRSVGWIRRLLPLMRPQLGLMVVGMVTAVAAMVLRVIIPRITQAAVDNSRAAHHTPLRRYVMTLGAVAPGIPAPGFTFRSAPRRGPLGVA